MTNKRRYLIISDELIQEGLKKNNHVHFDIIADYNITLALEQVIKHRPNVTHTTHLSLEEIEKIYIAMIEKTNDQLDKKFKENVHINA